MSAHAARQPGARRVLAVVVVAFGLSAAPAAACSIAVPPDYDPLGSADIALTGRVTALRYLDPAPAPGEVTIDNRRYVATIRVSRVYKGKTGRSLRIRGETSESLCGFGSVGRGQGIALLLDGHRSPFAVSLTSQTSYRYLEHATHGRSHRPGR